MWFRFRKNSRIRKFRVDGQAIHGTKHYSRIIVVDPRYYYGDVNGIFTKYAADDVLFLYSGNTFFEARIAD